MKKKFFLTFLSALLMTSCNNSTNDEDATSATEEVTSQMTEAEAKTIAEASCIKGGDALGEGTYNENSKTWWFEANLNTTKPGCMPACIVSEETKTANINWRCTGSIELEETKENMLTKINKDDRYVYYEGNLTLSGKYREYNQANLLGEMLCFYPDEASEALIPREAEDTRQAWFCFDDQEAAKAMFEINEKDTFEDTAVECIEGKATIEISNYVTDLLATEVFDEAKLEKIITKEPFSKSCL